MNPGKFLALVCLIVAYQVVGHYSLPFQNKALRVDDVSKLGDQMKAAVSKIGSWFNDGVAPARTTIQMIGRYHSWMVDYNRLRTEVEGELKLRDATTVLREEYTKADERYAAEPEVTNKNPRETYSALEVLAMTIEGLEGRLERLRGARAVGQLAEAEADEAWVDELRVAAAMERAKKATASSATRLLKTEMKELAQIGLFHSLAVYFDSKPDTGDPIDMLRPIVHMMGSASTPLLVSYLMSVEVRGLMGIFDKPISQALNGLRAKVGLGPVANDAAPAS